MSELFAGLVGLFILFVFGLIFIGVPIAIIVFLIVRKRQPRAPQQRRQGAGEFGGALDRDDNFTHSLSGGAYSSSVESSSSWDSRSGSSSDW